MNVYISQNDQQNLKCFGLIEHDCAVCGKHFECGGSYMYKRFDKKNNYTIYFCSYTCYRKDQKEIESKRMHQVNDWRVR